MQGLPHTYQSTAAASAGSLVTASTDGQPDLTIGPPTNFGGPGDTHTPEDLQCAAIASCFILSFKAIAAASKLEWEGLSVAVSGELDQVERAIQFTGFSTRAELDLGADASRDKAERLLQKAEQSCFITNSLKAESALEMVINGGE